MSEYIGNDDRNKLLKYDKERLRRFRSNLKKHLTNEYLTLSDRKDVLESDATQIKVEIERRDRTLFPANEHSDARKYFSPLNLTDLKDNQNSEKEKELNQKLTRINKETSDIESRMSEIMDFLRDLDDILAYYKDFNKDSDHDNNSDDDNSFDDNLENDKIDNDRIDADNLNDNSDDSDSEDKIIDHGQSGIKIDGNLKNSLYQLASYYMEKKPALEILLEYNCQQEEWGMDASKFIITQIGDQIYRARKTYNISMVLLEVSDHCKDDKKELSLTLSYDCEKAGEIKTARIVYHYGF